MHVSHMFSIPNLPTSCVFHQLDITHCWQCSLHGIIMWFVLCADRLWSFEVQLPQRQ